MSRPEHPMAFRETLPPAMQDWLWEPERILTLAFWPGGGYTQFESYVCHTHRYRAHNVSLCVQAPVPPDTAPAWRRTLRHVC